MTHKKYGLEFIFKEGECSNRSYGNYSILANFLMEWCEPIVIVQDLIPAINFGIKYGTDDRFSKYKDIPGMEEKMKTRWEKSNLKGIRPTVDVEKSWNRISEYTGYYIKEMDLWLEGINGDFGGLAFVTSSITTIELSSFGDSRISLPSSDFKNIVLEWLLFILQNKEIMPK
jgi:hypothetical protein